jgi:hypothetical protein
MMRDGFRRGMRVPGSGRSGPLTALLLLSAPCLPVPPRIIPIYFPAAPSRPGKSARRCQCSGHTEFQPTIHDRDGRPGDDAFFANRSRNNRKKRTHRKPSRRTVTLNPLQDRHPFLPGDVHFQRKAGRTFRPGRCIDPPAGEKRHLHCPVWRDSPCPHRGNGTGGFPGAGRGAGIR